MCVDSTSDNLVIDIDLLDPNFDSRSATNELPLSAIKFSSCSHLMSCCDTYDSPMSDAYDLLLHNTRPKISPIATNEKPLSLTPLSFVSTPPPLPPNATSASAEILSDPFKSHELGNLDSPPPFFPEYDYPQQRSVSCENLFTNSVLANSSCAREAASASSMYITSPFEFNSFNFYQHERNLRFGRIYSSSCETSLHKCASVDLYESCPSPARRNSASYASFYSYPGLIGSSTSPPLHVTGNSSKADMFLTGANTCDEITIELTVASRSQSNESCSKDNFPVVVAASTHPPSICINSEPFSSFDQEQEGETTPTLSDPDPKNITLDSNLTSANNACPDNNNQLTNVCPLTKQQRDQSQSCVNTTITNITTTTTPVVVVCCVANNNQKNVPITSVAKPKPTTTSTDSPQTGTRRQRHSIASGQMGVFKSLGFSRKMAASTNSLFSTAVISGSSSAPNLRDMIPSTATPSGKVLSKFINAHQNKTKSILLVKCCSQY